MVFTHLQSLPCTSRQTIVDDYVCMYGVTFVTMAEKFPFCVFRKMFLSLQQIASFFSIFDGKFGKKSLKGKI